MGNLIRSAGKASIEASAGDIIGDGPKSLITAETINLTAVSIGSNDNPLKMESTMSGTLLTANATGTGNNGLINLQSQGSRLFVDSVKGNNVIIASSGDLLMKHGSSGIAATNDIKATVNAGVIAAVNAQGAYTDRFKMKAGNNVTLSASSHILLEHEGDLYVDQISSIGGDLDILVKGNIVDKNDYEVPDPLSDAETYWKNIGLIEGTDEYNERIARKIDAYEKEFTLLYFQAWRDAGFDADQHNTAYQFRYSEEQRNSFLLGGMTEAQILAEEQRRTDLYHDALQSDYNSGYRYVASQEERDALTAFTGWSKERLENAIMMPMFILTQDAGTRNNTTSVIEKPNFSGHNITLDASGYIGSEIGDVTIASGKSVAQINENDVWRRALADAEWDDVTFNESGGTLTSVSIKRYDDIDIAATGTLTTRSAAGGTYLGSQSDICVDSIIAGTNGSQSLRLKIDGSIMGYDVNSSFLRAKNAILEAAGGTLGSVGSPLRIQLTGIGSDNWITARGTDGVSLSFMDGSGNPANANIREISSRGDVFLQAASFLNAQPEFDNAKIAGENIVLIATSGSIGTSNAWLSILQLPGGSLKLDAAKGDIYVSSPSSLDIVGIEAGGAVVKLTSEGNMALNGNLAALLAAVDLIVHGDFLAAAQADMKAARLNLIADRNIILDGNMTLSGTQGSGNALTFLAGRDILLGALITVRDGDIQWIAATGEIADRNDTTTAELNLDAVISAIQMRAALGIGSTNALELKADSLDLMTDQGNIVIDVSSSVVVNQATANDGGVDIYSAGTMRLVKAQAGNGHNVLFGAENDIFLAPNAFLQAGRDLAIVSNIGDIVSESTNDSDAVTIFAPGQVILAAKKGSIRGKSADQPFLTNLSGDKTHLIGMSGINLHNISPNLSENNPFKLGYFASAGETQIGTSANAPLTMDFIIAKSITLSVDDIYFNSLGSHAHIVLSDLISSQYNPSNQRLLEEPIDISITGSIDIINDKEGGKIRIDELDIRGTDQTFRVDHLVINSCIGDSDSRLSHLGNDGGIADSTLIHNIKSSGVFRIDRLYSRDVSIHSDAIVDDLIIRDGKVGINAPAHVGLNINGVRTEIDAANKTKTVPFDFWLWTFDGNYSLVSSQNGISFPDDSAMRALMRYRMNLLMNGDAFYGDTGFGTNLNDWRHFNENRRYNDLDEQIVPLFFQKQNSEMDATESLRTFDLFGDNPYSQDFRIVPLRDLNL